MDGKLHKKIEDRIEKGTLRSLSSFEGMTDFFSNDYLGLSSEKLNSVDGSFGATGSRLISGTSLGMIEVEDSIAAFFKSESSLMFNSGYDANLGFFSSVPQRGDTILYDELIHASVRDGIRLSLANGVSFKHNDVEDLKSKMERSKGAVYIAIESLYSMDGDIAPLTEIATLAKENGAYLMVDEAHACGVFGESGRGLVSELGFDDLVFAKLVTFGKGYGSHGACILGSYQLIQYLVNFARSFIYTTALPTSVFVRNLSVLISELVAERQKELHENIAYFRANYSSSKLISDLKSPIQIVEVGSVDATRRIAEKLQELKIAIKPIYSPTVAEGKERLRICIHSFNTSKEIDDLIIGISSEK